MGDEERRGKPRRADAERSGRGLISRLSKSRSASLSGKLVREAEPQAIREAAAQAEPEQLRQIVRHAREEHLGEIVEGVGDDRLGFVIAEVPDDRLPGMVARLPAGRLRELFGNVPQERLGRVVRELPDERLAQVLQEADAEGIQRMIDASEESSLVRIVTVLGERAPQFRLPDGFRLPADLFSTAGFPFAGLSDDRIRELAIVRPRDLLVLHVAFTGMQRTSDAHPHVRPVGDGPHLITVTLPPQHLEEQTFALPESVKLPMNPPKRPKKGRLPTVEELQTFRFAGTPELFSTNTSIAKVLAGIGAASAGMAPPVRARLAGPSRIVLRVPRDAEPIALTVPGILAALSRLELAVPPAVARAKEDPFSTFAALMGFLGKTRPPADSRGSASSAVLAVRRLAAVRSGMLTRSRSPLALPIMAFDEPPLPGPPTANETALELPYRLIIAPDKGASWLHRAEDGPEIAGHTELWTSELARRAPDGRLDRSARRTFRAVWTRDPKFTVQARKVEALPPEVDPVDVPLTAQQRSEIVHLTSNGSLDGGTYVPMPVAVNSLVISALGAWLDCEGHWEHHPDGLDLLMWRHRAAMGRDIEVRVAKAGFLAPFGHKATFLQITERRFHPGQKFAPAFLRKESFVVVREPERALGASGMSYVGDDSARAKENFDLQMPFTRVRITTKLTPALNKPQTEDRFWPEVADAPVLFNLEALDHGGREVQFRMPLLFVKQADLTSTDAAAELSKVYDGADEELRSFKPDGRLIAFANPENADDTSFATQRITFGLGVGKPKPKLKTEPPFAPIVLGADIEVPALKQFASEAARMRVAYHGAFLRGGFEDSGAGAGEVFLESVTPTALNFDHRAQTSGGFLTPNFSITGLSRKLGPVGGSDLKQYQTGDMNFSDIFANAKLFGVIDLWELLDDVVNIEDAVPRIIGQALDAGQAFMRALEQLQADAQTAGVHLGTLGAEVDNTIDAVTALLLGEARNLDTVLATLKRQVEEMPRGELVKAQDAAERRVGRRLAELKRQLDTAGFRDTLAGLTKGVELATAAHARMEWKPKLKKGPLSLDIFIPRSENCLTLAVEIAPDLTGSGTPQSSATCTLGKFDLKLGPVCLEFDKLELSIEPGQKPDVDVQLGGVKFEEELSFVQTLTEILPMDGFSDPPDLTVTDDGITASFSTSVPSVAVGVLSLQDLSLSASCCVPLIGSSPLRFRFDFCDPKRPAGLTVGMFGGAAYFGVEIAPLAEQSPLVALRGAFEFGAGVAMNFGVASGSVLVRAGIYFEISAAGKIDLAGYFRARGEVDVLGLVSLSIELRLELTYTAGKLRGRATLEIEIEIAWWSTMVSIECEREFAGGNADPTFLDLMEPDPELELDPWPEYCAAFA